MAVGQPGTIAANADAKRPLPLKLFWLKVVPHVLNHAVHRVTIEEQE